LCDPTHLFAEETPMTRYTRPFVVILLLIAVALLVAACGGSTGSENDASTGAATPTLEPVPAEVLARQMAAYVGQVGALQSPSDTLERPLNLVGITQAVDLTGGSPPCPGYVDTAPDYVFDLTTALSVLKIGFVGNDLGTVMVVTPEGKEILCTGLEGMGEMTLTPSLEIAQPAQGRYMVYVGRGNLSGANTGKLTVSVQ
jgi:hypothetical protein